jgi:FixJ family two-component response regulator
MAQVSEEAVRALKDAAEAFEQDTTNDEEIKDALRRAVQNLVAEATGSAGYAQIIEVLLTLD